MGIHCREKFQMWIDCIVDPEAQFFFNKSQKSSQELNQR
jgi:hypothetical protein